MSKSKIVSAFKSHSPFCVCVLLLLSGSVWSQAPKIAWELDEAMRQIERQANDFDSAMARVESVTVDSDGNEVSRSMGTGFIREDGRMRYNTDGGKLVTLVDRSTVMMYDADAKTVEEYSLRSHKERLEPFIRLGFSTTGRDLDDDFLLTILGEEDIGDTRTLVLELTPKRDSVRETVRLVRLWIDQSSWMPRQQQFNSTKDGTKTTLTYTGMARNLDLRPDLFREDWPRGTEKIRVK